MDECPICHQALATDADLCPHCRALLGPEGTAPAEPEHGSLDEQLLELLRAGRKIDAIKVFRERTQAGLKEAKDAVEALAAEHGVAPQKSGCAGVLLLILAGVAALMSAAWHG